MANQPARFRSSLPSDTGATDDDEPNFIAIREPLDAPNTSTPPGRATHQVHAADESDAEPLEWNRRLTARGKLWRGALASGIIAVACVAILAHAPLSTFSTTFFPPNAATGHAAPTPYPLTDLTTFQLTTVPLSAAHNFRMTIAPANDPEQTLYACWSAAPLSPKSHTGQIYLAYHHTTDNGYAWTPLPVPLIHSDVCTLTLDTINPKGILLSLDTEGYEQCVLPLLYYSADGGVTWTPVDWPATSVAACNLHMALVGGRLYAWNDTSLLPGSLTQLPSGRIITSLLDAKGAARWTAADNGLSDLGMVNVIGVRPGGGLLAVGDVASGGETRTLLVSADYGQTWSREGALPGIFPQVFVSSNPYDVAHGGWGRLYLQAFTANGAANGQGALFLATAYLGDGWRPLPLPPLSDATEANVGAPTVIGVGTDDTLLVMRGAISQRIASPGPPAKHLWLWESEHQHWLLNRDPTPANTIDLSASWTQGQATLWFSVLDPDVEPTIYLLSATFARQPPGAQHVAGG